MALDLVEQLRQKTQEALRAQTDEARLRAEAERVAAERIVAEIPSLALAEAERGRQVAAVMLVTYRGRPEFRDGQGYVIDPEQLDGASARVWEWCVANALSPHLVARWTSLESGMHRIDFVLCVAW